MIVLDASAAIAYLLGQQPMADQIAHRIERPGLTVHFPHLLDLEVAHVLRRLVRQKEMTAGRARAALEDLADLDATRYPHDFMIERIWELRNTLTAYDAAYVALAEALEAPLLTLDGAIRGSHGHRASIELVR